ncbi:hypothetical protein FACS1894200_05260 [Spirochaetia bacterium]|nr:hypothetical protein FACS1894200_05260 [Spirochaetia bacterium]
MPEIFDAPQLELFGDPSDSEYLEMAEPELAFQLPPVIQSPIEAAVMEADNSKASGDDGGLAALAVTVDDIRIEQKVDGGFHLYIRKKPGINSVLLTETTKDKTYQEANYAYRAAEWNAVNGNEIRLLNGQPLKSEKPVYSLLDSTPENHPELGVAFHIYIPYILHYGYAGSGLRYGEVYISQGTYLNIRAFSAPYADYRSSFRDNPFIINVTQKPLEGPPAGNFMKDTIESFKEIVSGNSGELIYSIGPADLIEKIKRSLERERGNTLDLVICLDTTNSMRDDIDAVRKALIPMLQEKLADFTEFRIGMVLYKDYYEEYLTKVIGFTSDFKKFQRDLNAIRVGGGKDIPEAVHEALYDAAVKFEWSAQSRLIVLIGDAPPHPRQRGVISKEMVDEAVAERGVRVNAIILPQ